jgi:FixJ family two-component response regulator
MKKKPGHWAGKFLMKPFSLQEMAETIRRALKH